MQNKVGARKRAGGGKKGLVVRKEEWWEVVAERANGGRGMTGRLPGGEPLGVDWCQFVNLVSILVGNPLGGITD
jgi:hypothetical protein